MDRKKDTIRGATLKKLRKERNLTQQQVADYLGLSKQAISKFEQGIPYSMDTAVAFANFYNVEFEYLLKRTKTDKLAQPVIDEMLQKKEIMDWVMARINPRIEQLEKRVEELESKIAI